MDYAIDDSVSPYFSAYYGEWLYRIYPKLHKLPMYVSNHRNSLAEFVHYRYARRTFDLPLYYLFTSERYSFYAFI